MERSRVALITLMCVLISSISGLIVEMRVKPGDNATIYCDCTRQHRFKIAWLRNCSHRQQPPLIMSEGLMRNAPPRYSFVWNISNTTYDLLVRNVSESDLGLYHCALHEIKFTRGRNGERVREDVYHEGNRTTFLSFLGVDPHQTSSVSDCSVCWKLLASVCSVCVLLTSTCVYHIYLSRTKADGTAERQGNMELRNHNELQVGDGGGGADGGGGGGDGGDGGGDDVDCAPLDILNSEQKEPTNSTDESSDVCTYSEVKFVEK